jgi:hypothetical protein
MMESMDCGVRDRPVKPGDDTRMTQHSSRLERERASTEPASCSISAGRTSPTAGSIGNTGRRAASVGTWPGTRSEPAILAAIRRGRTPRSPWRGNRRRSHPRQKRAPRMRRQRSRMQGRQIGRSLWVLLVVRILGAEPMSTRQHRSYRFIFVSRPAGNSRSPAALHRTNRSRERSRHDIAPHLSSRTCRRRLVASLGKVPPVELGPNVGHG